MSQNHALKMILSHSLIFIFIFSKQYMVLQSECLRVNLQNSPLDPLKNRFLFFILSKSLDHMLKFAFS